MRLKLLSDAGTLTGIVPGFSIGLNGTEISIPAQAAHAASGVTGNSDTAIKYADVQIYVGQFIDPTNADNLAKFISGGRPVNPAIAEAAFGIPTYRFNRPADDITNNTQHWHSRRLHQDRHRHRLHPGAMMRVGGAAGLEREGASGPRRANRRHTGITGVYRRDPRPTDSMRRSCGVCGARRGFI
jgi:hypothetical protein